MISVDGVTVEAALLCEDIREEINRKHALLGVFGGDILVQSLPATIKLAVYVVLRVTEPKERTLSIRARFAIDDEGLVAKATLGPQFSGVTVAIIPQFFVTTEVDGQFLVEISGEDGQWAQLISKSVGVGVIPSIRLAPLPAS